MLISAPSAIVFAIALILAGNLAGDLHLLIFHSAPRGTVRTAAHVCPVHGLAQANEQLLANGPTHRDPTLCPVCNVGGIVNSQSIAPYASRVIVSFAADHIHATRDAVIIRLLASTAQSRAPPVS